MNDVPNAIPEAKDPKRIALIKELSELSGGYYVNPSLHAIMWLSRLECLEWMVECGRKANWVLRQQIMVHDFGPSIRNWATHPTHQEQTSTQTAGTSTTGHSRYRWISISTPPKYPPYGTLSGLPDYQPSGLIRVVPTLTSSTAAKNDCIERDSEQCILTQAPEPLEIVPIYAGSLGHQKGSPDYETSWSWLRKFWGRQATDWEELITDPNSTELCENMVCMSSVVRALWRMGRFALQPLNVSEDRETMTVRFFWLPTLSTSDMLLTDPPSYPSGLSASARGTKIWNCVTERKIRSGDVITLTTDDPENLPLPSVKLLEMQWILNRVLALSGAAEFEVKEDGQHYASGFVGSQFDAGQFESRDARETLCDYEDRGTTTSEEEELVEKELEERGRKRQRLC